MSGGRSGANKLLQLDKQKKSPSAKDTKKITPRTVKPYSKRLKLDPETTRNLIEKIKREKALVETEMKESTPGLQEDDSVYYRLADSKKVYHQKVDFSDWPFPDASNIPGIIIPAAVDSMRGSVARALKVEPLAQPLHDNENRDIAIKKVKYIDTELRTGIDMGMTTVKAAVHDALLRGVGFCKRYTVIRKDEKKSRMTYKGEKGLKQFLKDYDAEDYPDIVTRLSMGEEIPLREIVDSEKREQILEYIDPLNMLVSPSVYDINKADFVGEITEYSAEQIVEEDFDNIEDLFDGDLSGIEENSDPIEVLHCEIMYDYKGDGKRRKMYCCLAVEKEILLLSEEHPNDNGHSLYISFFSTQYTGNFWRDGFYDKLKAVHYSHKEIVDIVLNSSYITMIPSFKAKNRGTFDPTKQDWYPGVVWYLDNLDDVEPMQMTSPQTQFGPWADKLQQYGYEMSGVSPYSQGAPVHAGESGEKIKTLLAAGGIRVEEVIENVNKGLNELFFQILEDAKTLKRAPMISIDGETTGLDLDIFAKGNDRYISSLDIASVNPDMVLQRTMLVLQQVAENPILQQSVRPEAVSEIAKEFFRSIGFGWEDRVDEIVMTQEEMMEREVQMRLQVQQEQQRQQFAQQAEALSEGLDENDLAEVQEAVQRQQGGQ